MFFTALEAQTLITGFGTLKVVGLGKVVELLRPPRYHLSLLQPKGEAPERRTGGVRGGGSPPATTFHHYLGTENPLRWDTTRPDFFQKKSFSEFSLPPFSKLTLKLTLILTLFF